MKIDKRFLYLGAVIICFLLLKNVSIDDSVFNTLPLAKEEFSWDEYVLEREKRNARKMQMSYHELMSMGRYYLDSEEWDMASENFFYAKSLFPDRIEPRKQLCYTFLMSCQDDIRFCTKAKKELYYAMKYVNPSDQYNFKYLSNLVALVQIEDIIELDEDQALAEIY